MKEMQIPPGKGHDDAFVLKTERHLLHQLTLRYICLNPILSTKK